MSATGKRRSRPIIRIHRHCVWLANRLTFGYEAVFDLGELDFRPMTLPSFADGSPVIRDGVRAPSVTDTPIYGAPIPPLSWRGKTALPHRLIAEAFHANQRFGTGSIGTGSIYQRLAKRPRFTARACPKALIAG